MTGIDLRFHLRRGALDLAVDTTLPAEGLTAIFGPSGAGKSTLLRVVAGFEPTGGRIAFRGEAWENGHRFLPAHRRGAVCLFQTPRLFAHLDVAGNLAYAARRAGSLADMPAVIERFGLATLSHRRTPTLSGGEAQRVALARALLARPRLLLMDEPLSALDAARRAEILPLIEDLAQGSGLPILYVSHSLSEVARLARTVLALADGRVQAQGPTASVLADPAAAPAFGGEEPGTLVEAFWQGIDSDGIARLAFGGETLFVPGLRAEPGDRLRLLIRARDVMIAIDRPMGLSALNILPATVEAIRPLDETSADVILSAAGKPLRARLTHRSIATLALTPGKACHAVLKSVALARDEAARQRQSLNQR